MRSFSSTIQNALLNRSIVFWDFLWLIPRDRGTRNAAPYGFHSGAGNVSASVINPLSGTAVTRNFEGAGALISISDISAVSTLEPQKVNIHVAQLNDSALSVVRGYDLKQGRVEMYSGFCDPSTRLLLEPPTCRYQGFVDFVDIQTPKEGEYGYIDLTCTSHSSELRRTNPDTRSHDSQQLRSSGDGFFKDVVGVSDWNIFWGQKSDDTASK